MVDSTPVNTADAGLEISTFFVRTRSTLLARADFGSLYVDYYLHHSEHDIHYSAPQDRLFKQALALFVLHCASRPWNELTAWTLHFEALRLNLFLTADNETGAVTGRLFDEDVREMNGNFFFSDVVRGREPKRRSVAQFDGDDVLKAVEAFYGKSEQRAVRAFALDEEHFALLSEHPDCDKTWLESLSLEQAKVLDSAETVVPMEKRVYRWHCGCNFQRMLEVLSPAYKQDPEGIFAGEKQIEMRCPRCGARHKIGREALEAFISGQAGK
jgi:molecular chaperone Hsp33